jgi:hypothetical protein
MEKWAGRITAIKSYGSHIELRIESRSSILVLIGQTTSGHFACMPDFGAGCYLADLKDIFWNTEKLTAVLGKVDGITVAYALSSISDQLHNTYQF